MRNCTVWATLLLILAAQPAIGQDAPSDPKPGTLPANVVQSNDRPPPTLTFRQPPAQANRQTIDWLVRRPAPKPGPKPMETPGDVVPASFQDPAISPEPVIIAEPPTVLTGPIVFEVAQNTTLSFEGLLRGYWRNDQRIYWSGQENTYGGEAIFRPLLQTTSGNWTVSGQGEIFVNQRYGSSLLSDPQRDLYRANFDVDPFEVFQLYGQAQYRDFIMRLGKTRTPFGGYTSPMFTNSLIDAPFLRTEVVRWTETGFFMSWRPGRLSADVGIVNGEPDLDTNSSKGVIARVGITEENWTLGTSVKWQDGISSEYHKRYNNVVGLDYSIRRGKLITYGEVIYDQYGFHRDFNMFGNPLNLGVRSIYTRDIFKSQKSPIHGVGYYVGLGYQGAKWVWDATFGSYFPEQIGNPAHDAYIHRGVVKGAYSITPNFQLFILAVIENVRPRDGVVTRDNPFAIVNGMQIRY